MQTTMSLSDDLIHVLYCDICKKKRKRCKSCRDYEISWNNVRKEKNNGTQNETEEARAHD